MWEKHGKNTKICRFTCRFMSKRDRSAAKNVSILLTILDFFEVLRIEPDQTQYNMDEESLFPDSRLRGGRLGGP